MGAGQIGGIATLLDINFQNVAGFAGVKASNIEAQFVVYYLSHAMLFCSGALIESHVVLTPASCVYGERYRFPVYAGTHLFAENTGTPRYVENICIHREYNHTGRYQSCSHNLALLVLNKQYSFNDMEPGSSYFINRVRYALHIPKNQEKETINSCQIYGWGSRRNGYLIPLLLELRRLDVRMLPCNRCHQMWNYGNYYLCLEEPVCKSEKYGALSPDDVGSVVVCNGYIRGMMTSRLVDRPAGVGFLDLSKFLKFITCGVDDSHDVDNDDAFFNHTTPAILAPTFATVPEVVVENKRNKKLYSM